MSHNDAICADIAQKVKGGERLSDAEKAHVLACEACLAQAMARLDKAFAAAQEPRSMNGSPAAAGPNPKAQAALAHGRRVFEREVGEHLRRER